MIRLVKQDDLDTEKWDACIRKDPSGHFYPYHWYLDMLAPRWDALVYGDYEWVMPLVHARKFKLIPYLYRPFGVQQLGIFGAEPTDASLVKSFLDAIPSSYLHIDIYLNVANQVEIPGVSYRRTYEIDLSKSYEQIHSGYNTQRKRDLKKAEKAGLTILENDSPDVLVRIFQENKAADIKNFTSWHFDRIRQIMYTMIYRKMGQVVSVYDEHNAVCASGFLASTSRRSVFLFSGQDEYGRKHGAMTKLIDHFLLYGSMRGGVFDFEGSDIPGLEEFYQSFGGVGVMYPHIKKSIL
jgi:hypothetical protein